MRIALAVAGSDPTGGAGLQRDLSTFRAFGVHGAGVVTALTVQDTAKVHQVLPAFPSVVGAQLRALLRDLRPHAVKLGMLASDDVLRAVAHGLAELPADEVPRVVDPVLLASDGTPLLERRAWDGLRELLRGAALVTPNLDEAAALSGRDTSTERGAELAGRALVDELGAEAALVKGGHREGDADDCLVRADGGVRWLRGYRIPGPGARGTGCALASAVAAGLAGGDTLDDAVGRARAFVRAGLETAAAVGGGAPLLGVVDPPGPER